MSGRQQVMTPARPTRAGPCDIRYDFNEGCRVLVPAGSWRIRISDCDTSSVLVDRQVDGGGIATSKKYFVRHRIELWRDQILVFDHTWNASDQEVLVRMEMGGLGDQIAWIGHAAEFAARHGCRITCCMRPEIIPLLQPCYPSLRLLAAADVEAERFYATYKVFIFYNDHKLDWSPCDYRTVGLSQSAAYILGLPPVERRPNIVIDEGGPPIDEPYVCIAAQASGQSKYWNNPNGWNRVIDFLHTSGFRVICIDLSTVNGQGLVWNHIPYGAEDQTGNRPLSERARWLRHAVFFVGLSSGLSWLAWATKTPVVMISGFTHPINEFDTPYRIINWHACNSCSNDIRLQLDPMDFFWCPRHAGGPRMFECTTLIAPEQVIAAIRTIPAYLSQAIESQGVQPAG